MSNNISLNNSTIISVIRKNSGIEIESVKYLGGGSFGRVYKCIDKNSKPYAFKVFLTSDIAEKEAFALKALAQNNSIKIPEVYFVTTDRNNAPFDCMLFEFIDGKNGLSPSLLFASKMKRQEFADIVIDAQLSIHNIKSDKFGPIDNPVYDRWLDFYRPFAQKIYNDAIEKNKEGKFDKYVLDIMKDAWKEFDNIFTDEVSEACLIHGDLNVMNIMIDKNLKPIAFIDPLNSMYADREYDLFQLMNLTGDHFNLYDNYKSKYKVSEKCDVQCAFYRLWNEAMVYLNTGTYTGFIMRSAIKYMKKQLKTL